MSVLVLESQTMAIMDASGVGEVDLAANDAGSPVARVGDNGLICGTLGEHAGNLDISLSGPARGHNGQLGGATKGREA
jgi:hypothetical protein